jgi:hypothetical protein
MIRCEKGAVSLELTAGGVGHPFPGLGAPLLQENSRFHPPFPLSSRNMDGCLAYGSTIHSRSYDMYVTGCKTWQETMHCKKGDMKQTRNRQFSASRAKTKDEDSLEVIQ